MAAPLLGGIVIGGITTYFGKDKINELLEIEKDENSEESHMMFTGDMICDYLTTTQCEQSDVCKTEISSIPDAPDRCLQRLSAKNIELQSKKQKELSMTHTKNICAEFTEPDCEIIKPSRVHSTCSWNAETTTCIPNPSFIKSINSQLDAIFQHSS